MIEQNEAVKSAISEEAEFLRAHLSVSALYLFGSVARNEASPSSDIDVLVDFTGGPTLRKVIRLKDHLENRLGRKVDLLTRGALHPIFVASVEREAIRVA